ncbi:glycosyltransferase family 2 protein [Chloroflexota bacterium]
MSKVPKQKILIAMPAYNEERYIGSLVLKAWQYGDDVLVVDDGSTDDTSEVAKLAGATVVRHEKNKGYGATIQSILKQAKKMAPEVLVLLDADAQHNPEDIPPFIKAISEGYDIAIGSRRLQNSSIPAYRRIGQRILLYMTRILSREELSDSESGFRAFSKDAVDMLDPKEQGMAVSAETIAIAAEKGLKITEVPISIEYTRDGSTLNPVRHGFNVLGRIIYMISERRPLFFFGIVGSVFMVIGLSHGVRVVNIFTSSGGMAVGTALLSVLFITIGVLSLFTGMILHALARRKD